MALLQRCGEDEDAAAELWDLKTQQSPRTTTTMQTPRQRKVSATVEWLAFESPLHRPISLGSLVFLGETGLRPMPQQLLLQVDKLRRHMNDHYSTSNLLQQQETLYCQ